MGRGKLKTRERQEKRLLKESLGLDSESIASASTDLTNFTLAGAADLDDISILNNNSVIEDGIYETVLECILVLEEKHTKSSSAARVNKLKKLDSIFTSNALWRENEGGKVEPLYDRLLDSLYVCLCRKTCPSKESALLCEVLQETLTFLDQEEYADDFERMLLLFEKKLGFSSTILKNEKLVVASIQVLVLISFLFVTDASVTSRHLQTLERYFPKGDDSDDVSNDTTFFGSDADEDDKDVNTNSYPFSVQAAALNGWGILVSTISNDYMNSSNMVEKYLPRLHAYLFSESLMVRTEAGENIAFLVSTCDTRVSDHNENLIEVDFHMSYEEKAKSDLWRIYEDCVEIIECLAKDGQKSKAKKERKIQRASFRVIFQSVKYCIQPIEKIKLKNGETINLSGWSNNKRLVLFRKVLKGGFLCHLIENELLHAVFDIGDQLQNINNNVQDEDFKETMKQLHDINDKKQTLLRKKQREAKLS
mmetsp:Transcript_11596/g.14455  ORF Transcript_11596/g.14455 Transcript_11596/m.14455 type:complete len:479 (+) Transcript_11596:198-1634(+)|eukprot:CAMPEP_0204858932 /NCGR_PEP_ID=MMETSP1347-20130617/23389_1 /ASSEMBLY_ACC=CAM_ASM_000690 /TAXON_ID=215587 /ORGANISM="Aplanochytrium stocchinoi, Strain GSBS06" /LENGTH=478 /DNA_ID=CAMNT_0052007297 /DNA_START=78 /DNA_END=1514 /DNA_ORIENTATION=-